MFTLFYLDRTIWRKIKFASLKLAEAYAESKKPIREGSWYITNHRGDIV